MELQLSVDAGLRMLRITEPQKPQALTSSNDATTSEDSEKLIIPSNQNNITSNATTTDQSQISSEEQTLSVCNDTSLPKNHIDSFNCTTNTIISEEQVVSGSHS